MVLSFITQQWAEGSTRNFSGKLFALTFLSRDHDVAVVLVVIISNTLIGFIQEYKGHKTMGALLKLAAPKAKVRALPVVLSSLTTLFLR